MKKTKRKLKRKRYILPIFLLSTLFYLGNYTLASGISINHKANSMISQQITVKGTISDQKTGDPIPGASVAIKGTTSATVTDLNGVYEITVPSEDAILVFSFVGYASRKFLFPVKK